MTFLEIVNDVLKKLREPTVTAIGNTDYSLMIGSMVNDAKREVENAHTWNCLRQGIDVTTVDGVSPYTLTGSGTRFVFDTSLDDLGQELIKAPISWIDKQIAISPIQGRPTHFCFDGEDTGNTKVRLFPVPDGVYNLSFYLYVPQADLSLDADVITIPGYLVAQNAYARAIAERGEDSGNLSSEAYALYTKALADAIAIERNRYEEDINWEAI